jgi:hypothetical protein
MQTRERKESWPRLTYPMPTEHNRDIATAARSILRPLGCIQKGRSRTWLDDRGWWVGLVEFQPSGWSKGSYLNVGACFLWRDGEDLSFDDLMGDKPWYPAKEGESFADEATTLATQARDRVLELRQRHSDMAKTAAWMNARGERLTNWGHFHAAVASGLCGSIDDARRHFAAAVLHNSDIDWVIALNQRCVELAGILEPHLDFTETIWQVVSQRRRALGFPEAFEPAFANSARSFP